MYLSVSIFTITVFCQPSTYRSALASHRYRSTLRYHIWRRGWWEPTGVSSQKRGRHRSLHRTCGTVLSGQRHNGRETSTRLLERGRRARACTRYYETFWRRTSKTARPFKFKELACVDSQAHYEPKPLVIA